MTKEDKIKNKGRVCTVCNIFKGKHIHHCSKCE